VILVWPQRKTGGALVEGPRAVHLGVAVVKETLCLTFPEADRPAEACRVCVDRCPFPDEAIRLVPGADGQPPHPMVVEEVCTGCGLCVFGCPTLDPAIIVEPRR